MKVKLKESEARKLASAAAAIQAARVAVQQAQQQLNIAANHQHDILEIIGGYHSIPSDLLNGNFQITKDHDLLLGDSLERATPAKADKASKRIRKAVKNHKMKVIK